MDENKMDIPRLPNLIGIGGGIGSGKSVVCKILRAMGYEVYDCDVRAKQLMEKSDRILNAIKNSVCPAAINTLPCGCQTINRKILADAVFTDKNKLSALNAIVHTEVRRDIFNWYSAHFNASPIFIESAIITDSHLDQMVETIWEVTAPENLRIQRVISRDGHDINHILARMQSQQKGLSRAKAPIKKINNDGITPLLPQILNLLTKKS